MKEVRIDVDAPMFVVDEVGALLPTEFAETKTPATIISLIKKAAMSIVPDPSTHKGRVGIRSTSAQVTRYRIQLSKTIDSALKDLKVEYDQFCEPYKNAKAFIKTELDALSSEVRKPLTEWEKEQDKIKAEEAEKARKAEEAKAAEEKRRLDEIKAKEEDLARREAEIDAKLRKLEEAEAKECGKQEPAPEDPVCTSTTTVTNAPSKGSRVEVEYETEPSTVCDHLLPYCTDLDAATQLYCAIRDGHIKGVTLAVAEDDIPY